MPIEKLKAIFNIKGNTERIKHFDDDEYYDVWKIESESGCYIIKKTKEFEADIYETIFKDGEKFVPAYFGKVCFEKNEYIMLENVEGENANYCTKEKIIKVIDSLTYLQDKYWQNENYNNVCYNLENSLVDRLNRGQFIKDEKIEKYYENYIALYKTAPRTLCNDDFLPFNVLINGEKATIIDWEESGILPYLSSLARFIAHSEEKDDELFFMRNEDKNFAIDYYYEKLLKEKGKSYNDYRYELNLFLIYEYCEWIMLYNKYENGSKEMHDKYKEKAYRLISEMENP